MLGLIAVRDRRCAFGPAGPCKAHFEEIFGNAGLLLLRRRSCLRRDLPDLGWGTGSIALLVLAAAVMWISSQCRTPGVLLSRRCAAYVGLSAAADRAPSGPRARGVPSRTSPLALGVGALVLVFAACV